MRLTRHAKNRLRWIQRAHDELSEAMVLEAIPMGHVLGYDERGHRRVLVAVGDAELVLVIDEGAGLVVTLWAR